MSLLMFAFVNALDKLNIFILLFPFALCPVLFDLVAGFLGTGELEWELEVDGGDVERGDDERGGEEGGEAPNLGKSLSDRVKGRMDFEKISLYWSIIEQTTL